eukprot:TRINITY_DN2557_c0_g1_i1.p1 TRINITY_DN2557_c0_g1~~TRINITY_DN2557_c0_g1_i1.p1  ORF type:complete len:150 (+),score=12.61 TRINITY_DN2557_c0_g1_i1:3-452(+)
MMERWRGLEGFVIVAILCVVVMLDGVVGEGDMCVAGTKVDCSSAHGTGERECKRSVVGTETFWGPCILKSCDKGYKLDVNNNECSSPWYLQPLAIFGALAIGVVSTGMCLCVCLFVYIQQNNKKREYSDISDVSDVESCRNINKQLRTN